MCYELVNTIINLLGIIIGVIVALYVHKLSQQQKFNERFTKRQSIQKQIDDLLYRISNGGSSKVELINLAKYDTHYPKINNKTRHGYTYLGAELKDYYYSGVEFFCEIITAYELSENKYSRKQLSKDQKEVNLYMTGIVPYEWVESIDMRGDDTTNRPQFYTHFNGKKKSPYSSISYYRNAPESPVEFVEVELIK
ncbi:MAG: hypothetical protein KBC33_03025 [Candidatus Pacebacteria bacterium]|nr:hypothetical protein [Candidatus Paceibacterota bacterium]